MTVNHVHIFNTGRFARVAGKQWSYRIFAFDGCFAEDSYRRHVRFPFTDGACCTMLDFTLVNEIWMLGLPSYSLLSDFFCLDSGFPGSGCRYFKSLICHPKPASAKACATSTTSALSLRFTEISTVPSQEEDRDCSVASQTLNYFIGNKESPNTSPVDAFWS